MDIVEKNSTRNQPCITWKDVEKVMGVCCLYMTASAANRDILVVA